MAELGRNPRDWAFFSGSQWRCPRQARATKGRKMSSGPPAGWGEFQVWLIRGGGRLSLCSWSTEDMELGFTPEMFRCCAVSQGYCVAKHHKPGGLKWCIYSFRILRQNVPYHNISRPGLSFGCYWSSVDVLSLEPYQASSFWVSASVVWCLCTAAVFR